MRLWTGYAAWDKYGETEELDVHADTYAQARAEIVRQLDEDYLPGYRLVAVEERVPEVSGWSL